MKQKGENEKMPTRILVRHLAGSKINQVEEFPVESFPELSIGRETGATILFDPARDDTVSRRHAIIKVTPGDPPNFKLSDLGSSNGTFLNGERIAAETELLPGDTIELGRGGPNSSSIWTRARATWRRARGS
jgi:serine protease Do